jgi:hypothetical protein
MKQGANTMDNQIIKKVLNAMFDNGLESFIEKMVFSKARYKDDYFKKYFKTNDKIYYLTYNQYSNMVCSNIEIELQEIDEDLIGYTPVDSERIVLYDTVNDAWDSFRSKHDDDNLTDSEMDALYEDEYKDIIFEDVIDILSNYCY